jgi:hypothetical protein
MNRQIHQWLVVDFESNERDPRTTPLRTEYDGLTIHIQPRMDEYCKRPVMTVWTSGW